MLSFFYPKIKEKSADVCSGVAIITALFLDFGCKGKAF